MIGLGRRNVCTVDELHDLVTKYEDLKESLANLFNSQAQMSPQEFTQAAKRLAAELKTTAQQIKDCQRTLVDPEKDATDILQKYSLV